MLVPDRLSEPRVAKTMWTLPALWAALVSIHTWAAASVASFQWSQGLFSLLKYGTATRKCLLSRDNKYTCSIKLTKFSLKTREGIMEDISEARTGCKPSTVSWWEEHREG